MRLYFAIPVHKTCKDSRDEGAQFGSRTKSPRTKSPSGQNLRRQNPLGQNPPIIFYIQYPLPPNSKYFLSDSVLRSV